jgi:hypothetical protein
VLEDNASPTDGHTTRSDDTTKKTQCTTTRGSTQAQPREEAPETEEDILERMIVLSQPAEAKKAAMQVIEAKKKVRF